MTEGQDSPSGGKMGSAMDYIGELAQSSHFKLNLFLTGEGTGGADEDLNTWLKIIDNVSKNFQSYNQIRYNAFIFAKKENMLWRAKKILGKEFN